VQERVNWTLDPEAVNTLKRASRISKASMGKIVSKLIQDHLADPIKVLDKQIRQKAQEISQLQERRDHLMELQKQDD